MLENVPRGGRRGKEIAVQVNLHTHAEQDYSINTFSPSHLPTQSQEQL